MAVKGVIGSGMEGRFGEGVTTEHGGIAGGTDNFTVMALSGHQSI